MNIYDGLDRLVGEKLSLGKNLSTYSYTYDKAGNRKSLDITTGTVGSADMPDRITTLNNTDTPGIINMLSRKHIDYTYNHLNQLEKVNNINAPENILNLKYDIDGNLTSDGKGIYEYDVFGHMIRAELGS